MFVKAFAGLGAVGVGGAWMMGAFAEYPRVVDGSPELVLAELADLDIREMPGSPGTDAIGGVVPRFQMQKSQNRLDWFVMNGSQVATQYGVALEPVDGGTRTRIVPYVQRGDAPDDRTSPAFRSEAMTMSLFITALNTEIDEIGAPGWGEHCDALVEEQFAVGGPVSQHMVTDGKPSREQAIRNVAGAVGEMHRARKRMLDAGCNPDIKDAGGFKEVSSEMGAVPSGGWPVEAEERSEPAFGEPMHDPNP